MDFSLVHAGLAAGAAFAAVPLILHLFMRQTPKRIVFPAMRLIRERQKRSRKRLKVKNWLLLLMRMLLLAFMALALARPRITSEASSADEQVPCAIGLVFDTSPSMGYKEREKTRLDEAKEQAAEILKKTPSSSQIYIIDSSEGGVPSPLSPASAQKKISELKVKDFSRPLNPAVGQAYAGIMQSELDLLEIYVFTDLARSAWDLSRPVENLEASKASKRPIKTFVARLTPKDPVNVAVVGAGPISKVVTENQPLEISVKIQSKGPKTDRVVELWIDGQLKDKKHVEIEKDAEIDVKLVAPKVSSSTAIHQGEVRITGTPDPLEFDDRRYFSFKVSAAIRVLIISDLPIDADFIGDALDPEIDSLAAPRPIIADRIRPSQLRDKSESLGSVYRCIFLNNVAALSEQDWGRLAEFARQGGGIVLGFGNRARVADLAGTSFDFLTPALLEVAVRATPTTTFGRIEDRTGPLFARYLKELEAILANIPVTKYWRVKPREGSRVLLKYADQSPALIERVIEGPNGGRVLLWTTPLSRRPEVGSQDAWNEFPNDTLGWSFYYLMNQTVSYLVGGVEENYDFEAGDDVLMPIDPSRRFNSFLVRSPDNASSDPLKPNDASKSLMIVAPQKVGNWKVDASTAAGVKESLGFSLNALPAESQLTPLEESDLNALFDGKDRYALADDKESLERIHALIRVGRELFPWLMILIMLVVTVESVMSNRFHKESNRGPQPTTT